MGTARAEGDPLYLLAFEPHTKCTAAGRDGRADVALALTLITAPRQWLNTSVLLACEPRCFAGSTWADLDDAEGVEKEGDRY